MEQKGTLFLVATPIGNLGDISERALSILSEIEVIAAEDTRVARKLLNAKGIAGSKIISYYDVEKEPVLRKTILSLLEQGKNVALVTDAGSPCISDPGYRLVRDASNRNFTVTSVPGPCAAICSLQLSAVPSDRFAFFGYLPRKGSKRHEALDRAANFCGTVVFYESPRRLAKSLVDLAERFPGAKAAVCRELTKLYEEIARGTIDELVEVFGNRKLKGEIVIVIETPTFDPEKEKAFTLASRLRDQHGLSAKDASQIAGDFSDIGKKQIYDHLIGKNGGQNGNQ